jgi:hypothetical protein
MVTIREAHALDFPQVYPLLREFRNEQLTEGQWRQLFVDHTGLQDDRFGWVLVDGANVVGFIGTILSERRIRGEVRRLCNLSSWIVKRDYRAHSIALHARAVADKSLEITSLSPTPGVLKLLQRMGFAMMDKSERIVVPVPTPRSLIDACEIITDPRALQRILHGDQLRFFQQHQLPHNRHALLRTREGACYLMMNRTMKAIRAALRLPFARVHHISAPEVFTRHSENVVARIAVSLRVVALIVDDRMLQGRKPWHSFARPGGKRVAAFRSTVLREEDIDGLYSEAVLLNY